MRTWNTNSRWMNGTISPMGNVLQDVVDADDQIIVLTADFLPHEAPSHGLARALSFPLRQTIQPQFGPQPYPSLVWWEDSREVILAPESEN
jgi:hypothetical protein